MNITSSNNRLTKLFTKLYNSSNEEDNELIQTMCNELYSKYIKYELPIALASNVVPPAPEKFIKSPSSWKEWVLKCLDPNGDNDNSDRTFDEEGNWIGDPFIWPES